MERDPFVTLDEEGVGELIQLAMQRGHKTRPRGVLALFFHDVVM